MKNWLRRKIIKWLDLEFAYYDQRDPGKADAYEWVLQKMYAESIEKEAEKRELDARLLRLLKQKPRKVAG